MSSKYQYFNGFKFTRDDKTGYYLNSSIRKRIHRYIWEYCNGEIPKGMHVHHKDGDKSNNDICNFEILNPHKHQSIHTNDRIEKNGLEIWQKRMEYARAYADDWHKSEEGRKWHKEHYKKHKEAMHKTHNFICKECGKEFQSTQINSKFCSNKCKSRYRRKSGVDDVIRQCEYCKNEFKVNKYSKTKYCSQSCSNRAEPRLPQLRKNKID